MNKIIGGYHLIREVQKENSSRKYRFGIYKNESGQLAFAKQWVGTRKNQSYYWLQNEIVAYETLENILKNKIYEQNRSFHVCVPKFLFSQEEKGSLTLFIEYINGRNLVNEPEEKKLAIYQQLFELFHDVSAEIEKTHRPKIIQRTIWHWVGLLPIICTRAVLRHPREWRRILKGVIFFLSRIFYVATRREVGFVHRDLNDRNILIRGNNIWILDFQLAALANPILEYATTLLESWGNQNFSKKLLNSTTFKLALKSKSAREVFRAFAVYFAIYDLGLEDGESPQVALDYLRYNLGQKRKNLPRVITAFLPSWAQRT